MYILSLTLFRNMYTVEAFNQMLVDFLNDLCRVFPDRAYLKKYQTILNAAIMVSPESIVDKFMQEVKPFADDINQRNGDFFSKAHGEIMNNLHLEDLWKEDLPDTTRDNIWKYLNTLLVIGTLIRSVDKNMLSGIENMAAQLMNDPGAMDLTNIMGSLGSILGNQTNLSLPEKK